MLKQLILIGIDSLDPFILKEYKRFLPTFSEIMKKSPNIKLESIFPVDSVPAWATIHSGLHPGNHGIFYAFDVFDKDLGDLRKIDRNRLIGKTFWDYAGKQGYHCIVLFPMLVYPPYKINGILVGKSPYDKRIDITRTERDVSAYPKDVMRKYNIPKQVMDIWGGFPGISKLTEWAKHGKVPILEEAKIGLSMFKKEKFDLFFIYFHSLDIIQHRLWRFFDQKDPTYRYLEHIEGIIINYYRIYDEIIRQFINTRPNATFLIFSDHGHKSRPYKTFNVNEFFRRKGFLMSRNSPLNLLYSKMKKIGMYISLLLEVEDKLVRIVTSSGLLTKMGKSVYSSSKQIGKNSSLAKLSTFAGIKSYPHGGIELNRDVLSPKECEKLSNKIISELKRIKKPDSVEPLLKWAMKSETLYPGNFTESIYPDIVFQFDDEFGVGWDIHSRLFGKSFDHKLASGGHSKQATFLALNLNREIKKSKINLMDLAPTILDLLGIDWTKFHFDGSSIF